jgi:hypothetical protein
MRTNVYGHTVRAVLLNACMCAHRPVNTKCAVRQIHWRESGHINQPINVSSHTNVCAFLEPSSVAPECGLIMCRWIDEAALTATADMIKLPKSKLHQIGHFTAMSWGQTDQVGCGFEQSCTFQLEGMQRPLQMGYLVCRYKPGCVHERRVRVADICRGNIYDYPAYTSGTPCSACAQHGLKCNVATKLCA